MCIIIIYNCQLILWTVHILCNFKLFFEVFFPAKSRLILTLLVHFYISKITLFQKHQPIHQMIGMTTM